MHFYKWLERTYPLNGKTITANVKDATADLRALAKTRLAELKAYFGGQTSGTLAFAMNA